MNRDLRSRPMLRASENGYISDTSKEGACLQLEKV